MKRPTFNVRNPLATDPTLEDVYPNDYAWGVSKEPDCFYFWSQPVAKDAGVSFYRPHDPKTIRLCKDVYLIIYRGTLKQELLYRLKFEKGLPEHWSFKPEPYCIFWTFGKEGGSSSSIKYHYRDRNLTIMEWTDKRSFLAILRQQHYLHEPTFWRR